MLVFGINFFYFSEKGNNITLWKVRQWLL